MSRASTRASGMEAAEVLPVRWRTRAAFSRGIPSRLRAVSMIRMLAWWGTTRAMSSIDVPARSMAVVAAFSMASTALRNTSWPCMTILSSCSQYRRSAAEPSDIRSQPRRLGWEPLRSITTAPAPSPNRTQVVRSSQLVNRLSASLPIRRTRSMPPSTNCMAVTSP